MKALTSTKEVKTFINNNPKYFTNGGKEGGYNKCIYGDRVIYSSRYPFQNSVLPNCTGYAYGRFMYLMGKTSCNLPTCNAGDWFGNVSGYDKAPSDKGTVAAPRFGAVACWKGGSQGYGHVAIVEKIEKTKDGLDFYVSESGYGDTSHTTAAWFRDTKVTASNNYARGALTFQGFIYNPRTLLGTEEQDAFIKEAKSHIGKDNSFVKKELDYDGDWNCAYVIACAKKVGILESVSNNVEYHSTPKFYSYWRKIDSNMSIIGSVGDILFYSTTKINDTKYLYDRCAIIVNVKGTTLTVMEGDVEGKVAKKTFSTQSYFRYAHIEWEDPHLDYLPLYNTKVEREDALIRQALYMNTSFEATTSKYNEGLSLINYCPALEYLYQDRYKIAPDEFTEYNTSTNYSPDDSLDKKTYNFIYYMYKVKGLSLAAAVGIAANVYHESTFITSSYVANDAGDGPSGGLCGWHDSNKYKSKRFTNMKAAVGDDWKTDFSGQMDYIYSDLKDNFKNLFNDIRTAPNNLEGAQDCAEWFVKIFEVPAHLNDYYDSNGKFHRGQIYIRRSTAESFWDKFAATLSKSNSQPMNSDTK